MKSKVILEEMQDAVPVTLEKTNINLENGRRTYIFSGSR